MPRNAMICNRILGRECRVQLGSLLLNAAKIPFTTPKSIPPKQAARTKLGVHHVKKKITLVSGNRK